VRREQVRPPAVVERTYAPEPEAATRALMLLLKSSVKKAVHPDGPDSVRSDRGAHTIDRIISK
jgi:hypothetical protein